MKLYCLITLVLLLGFCACNEVIWTEYEVTYILTNNSPRNTLYTVYFKQVGTKVKVITSSDNNHYDTLKVGDHILGYITPEREFVWKKK